MKKNNLLNVLGIAFLIFAVLTWVIPAGSYSNGDFISGSLNPMGLLDLVRYPLVSIATFVAYGLIFLAVGGFYGVVNKTGVYTQIVEKITKKYQEKKNTFLVIAIAILAGLSTLFGLTVPLFLLVPFFATILLRLNFSKITTFAATIGSILVGNISSISGFEVIGYFAVKFEGFLVTNDLFARIILFLILAFLFVMFVLPSKSAKEKNKGDKKNTKKESEELEIPLFENTTSKKSALPLIVISIFMFVLLVVGMYNWYYTLKFGAFMDIHDALMSFEINGFTIFSKLLGNITYLGGWGHLEFVIVLILFSFLIGWVYNLHVKETCEGFLEGAKKVLPTAIYAVLACTIFAALLNLGTKTISATITNFILGEVDGLQIVKTFLTGGVGGLFYNDFYYLLNSVSSILSLNDQENYSLILMLLSGAHAIMMLILPTSILLFAGLRYFEISFKEWISYIWKYLVLSVFLVLIVVGILTLF